MLLATDTLPRVATQLLPPSHVNVAMQMLPRKCCHANVATQMLPRKCCHANVATQMLPRNCCHANVATQMLPRKCCHANVATQMLPRKCCHANVATQMLPRKCCHANVATQMLPPLSYAVASRLLQRSSCLQLIQNRKGVEPTASDQKRKIDRAQSPESNDLRPFSPKI